MPRDRLTIDILRDLKRVDNFVNKLISSRAIQRRFFENPSRVMIELGFHPPTTNRAIGITNRVFYATLTNKKLIRHCIDNAPRFKIPKSLKQKTLSTLDKGRVEVDPRVDQIILKAYFKDEKHLRQMFLLSLLDLNRRGILTKRFKEKEIRGYVEKILLHIRKRQPIREMPVLDRFGPRYGVGAVGEAMDEGDTGADTGADVAVDAGADAGADGGVCTLPVIDTAADGGVCTLPVVDTGADMSPDAGADAGTESGAGSTAVALAEAGVAATTGAATEAIAFATVFIPVLVAGVGVSPVEQLVAAFRRDRRNFIALVTMTKLVTFASDLALYVRNIDRLDYYGKP